MMRKGQVQKIDGRDIQAQASFVAGLFQIAVADILSPHQSLQQNPIRRLIAADPAMAGWRSARTHRVARGFYTFQALEVVRG